MANRVTEPSSFSKQAKKLDYHHSEIGPVDTKPPFK